MMSKVKDKKPHHGGKGQKPNSEKKSNSVKRILWFKEKIKNKKLPTHNQGKAEPPKDVQHFSANWKAFQEVLKASQPAEKPPVKPQKPNGTLRKKEAKEEPSKTTSDINSGPKQTDTGQKAKHKTVPNTAVPKEAAANPKALAVSQTSRPPAQKRKKNDIVKSKREPAAKKIKKPVVTEKKPTEDDMWFDDVDPDDIEATVGAEAAEIMRKKQGVPKTKDAESALVKDKAFEGLTRAVAIDCEMVGVGPDGEESILARVSLVNHFGKCIYDKYVKATEKVTDYRTAVSGIRPKDIEDGEDVRTVQREVAEILQGRIVVGHAIHNDLKLLLLDHPKKKIRDTQKYKPFKKSVKSGRPSLKVLCREILNVKVQQGEHSSVQDAQAAMRLYTMAKKQWEAEIKASHKNKDSEPKSKKRKPKLPRNKGKNPRGS